MQITVAKLKSVNGKTGFEGTYTDRDNLSVRISPKGKIVFQQRLTIQKKPVRLKIGTYPVMMLSKAREKATENNLIVTKGLDPRYYNNDIHDTSLNDQCTVKQGFEYWVDEYATKYRTDKKMVAKMFEMYVYDAIGSIKIEELTTDDWMMVLKPMAKNYACQAGKLLKISKQVFRYLAKQKKGRFLELEIYDVKDIGGRSVRTKERFLDYDEIKILINFLYDQSNYQVKSKNSWGEHRTIGNRNITVMKLLLFFGCRTKELRVSLKSDFDLDKMIWTVPKGNSKNSRRIRRPIHPLLVDDIKRLISQFPHSKHLVPPESSKKDIPVTASALTSISSMINERIGLESWSAHDLRRTLDTNLSEDDVQYFVIKKMIGHTMKGVDAHYNKADYLSQQNEAYSYWINKLHGFIENKSTSLA